MKGQAQPILLFVHSGISQSQSMVRIEKSVPLQRWKPIFYLPIISLRIG
jgi:hypothetical protein